MDPKDMGSLEVDSVRYSLCDTYLASEKYEPVAASCDQVSPTILAPEGMVIVDVRIYVPASTKRILPKLAYRAAWKAAVSSVEPSPAQPRSLVCTNDETA